MSFQPQYKDSSGAMQNLPLDADTLDGYHASSLINQNAFGTVGIVSGGSGYGATASKESDVITFNAGDGISLSYENNSLTGHQVTISSATACGYATCSTAAATVAKTVACTGFKLAVGAMITVKFTYAHTSTSAATLNVNSTGAKTVVWRNGATVVYSSTTESSRAWLAGAILTLIYDGTYWRILTVDPHPVGSIYMSTSATSPASLFGGTWSRIYGRFLLGAGANTANTSTAYGSLAASVINRSATEQGGEVTHTLTVNEMPAHCHTGKGTGDQSSSSSAVVYTQTWGKYQVFADFTDNTGGSAAHNNMPPYYVVYIWRRTA